MISLKDMVRSTVNCALMDVKERGKKYEIYNQMEDSISIVNLANMVKNSVEKRFGTEVKVEHIPNPRIEDEEHQMVMANDKFISDTTYPNLKPYPTGKTSEIVSVLQTDQQHSPAPGWVDFSFEG